MGVHNFEDLKRHIGHRLECVAYIKNGATAEDLDLDNTVNIAVECIDCNEVILDFDREEKDDLEAQAMIDSDHSDWGDRD